jgi:hypothetical protein
VGKIANHVPDLEGDCFSAEPRGFTVDRGRGWGEWGGPGCQKMSGAGGGGGGGRGVINTLCTCMMVAVVLLLAL